MLFDLNLNELHYHSLMTSLDRCIGSCNTPLEDRSDRICFE